MVAGVAVVVVVVVAEAVVFMSAVVVLGFVDSFAAMASMHIVACTLQY